MSTYSEYEIDKQVRNPKLQELFEEIMDITSGHDHDGTNSKAVTTGTPANGSVTNTILATDVKVGSLATLTTTEVASVVGAINELDAEIGDLSTLTTTATTVATAINEIDADVATAIANAASAAAAAIIAQADANTATAAVAAAVTDSGTETLSNKTLTAPKIVTTGYIADAGGDEYLKFVEAVTPVTYVQITSGNTTVKPIVQGAGETNIGLQLMGSGTGNVTIVDATTPSKALDFELVGATSSTMTTITASQTDNRTITLPDATDTLVGKATTDVLTNKTLTLPQINDTSADHQYVFAVSELTADRTVTLPLLTGADEFAFKDHAQTFTNKTLTTPVVASFYQDAGKTKLMTVPNTASDTLCAIAATQTLSGKTLSATKVSDDCALTFGTTVDTAETKITVEFDETSTGIGQIIMGSLAAPQVLNANPGATVVGETINILHSAGAGDCGDLIGAYVKTAVSGDGDAGTTVVGHASRAYVGTAVDSTTVASQFYASQPWVSHYGTGAVTAMSGLSAKCDVNTGNFTATTVNAGHFHIEGASTVTSSMFDGVMIEVYPDVTCLDAGLRIAVDTGATVTAAIAVDGATTDFVKFAADGSGGATTSNPTVGAANCWIKCHIGETITWLIGYADS